MLLAGKRIVYIEDDARNRMLVEALLKAEGADVFFERWGTPATALNSVIMHLPVDLILLDLMFPGGFSGYKIFETLRDRPILDKVPIVMVSAADSSVEMVKAKAMGFSGYIAKPIDAPVFAQQIHDMIEAKPVWFEAV